MSVFTGPLKVEFLENTSGNVALLQDLGFEEGAKGSGRWIIVPKGARSNGVSTPRIFWFFVPPHGHIAARAGQLHDHLVKLCRNGTPHEFAPTRKAADAVFYDALRALGLGKTLSFIMWVGVRCHAIFTGEK